MIYPSSIFILILLILSISVNCTKINRGQISLIVSQQHQQDQKYKFNLNSKLKSILELTQSSKINMQVKLQSTPTNFKPEFFSFRLRHSIYQNITEPVLAQYNGNDEIFTVTIDLGDPRQIKPFSDKYQLEIIIADETLDKNIRHILADCNIVFRKSWKTVPNSELHHKASNIIETHSPPQREDPPKIFTLFVSILVIALNIIFYYGLAYLKVNVKLFPYDTKGFLFNVGFLAIFMANLAILLKFWINWTFLQTLQYLLILILPTALISNYSFVHIKKD